MIKVLKEFFRLKAEEIGEFFAYTLINAINEVWAVCYKIVGGIIALLLAVTGVGWCIELIPAMKEINAAILYETGAILRLFLVGYMWALFLGATFVAIYFCIIIPKRWLYNNWQQAKRNMRHR